MLGIDEDYFEEMCALEEHQELYGIPARQAEQQEENNNQMFQQDHDQERENRRGPDPPEPDSGVLVSNENEGSDQCLELVCMPMIKNAGPDLLKPDHEHLLSSLHEKYDFETLSWTWAKQKELFEEQNLNFLIEMQAAGLKYNKRTGKYINSILGAYEEGFEYMEGVKSAEIYIHPRQLAPIIEELNALYECHWFIDQLRANMKANRWGSYFVATNTEHIICY
ncbi:hypothetical protein L3Y34_011119 [Caenorhabditis briggsae]|uniref:Uncharacterized protein n=1 Tax=Caenorhabditis briggsae TaxID=6238 RepID=A0AAE8ZVL4_CAEBR|nr:hypothetical protein L3Y34_011119 [Caenorhabditis briggsae]